MTALAAIRSLITGAPIVRRMTAKGCPIPCNPACTAACHEVHLSRRDRTGCCSGIADDADDEAINDLIDQWLHGAGGSMTLFEFLGMTEKQYAQWLDKE